MFDDGAHDDETVVGADHHVPEVEELQSLVDSEAPAVVSRQEDAGLVLQQLSSQQSSQTEEQRAETQDDDKQVEKHNKCGVH